MRRAGSIFNIVFKVLVLVAIIAVGLIIYQTCSGSPLVQRVDMMEPGIDVAPFIVPTATGGYYAREATLNDDDSVTMTDWYEYENNGWKFHTDSIRLPKALRPEVKRR